MSKVNKPPLSLSKLIRYMEGKDGKIAVVVGTVTNDIRVYEVPALKASNLVYKLVGSNGFEMLANVSF
ncbi:hypothetical protein CMV_030548 [Castanea mollissima]|uniref:Large ribosomal subunit protein uL15/eL18 domain-containing protein n=1 Tax=Castanea mollissima TaxID=60419 RepID=A0A8J4Q2Y5_9ROSI|nr:hypothetical protein CMV_030548 [Castanea mollissima]